LTGATPTTNIFILITTNFFMSKSIEDFMGLYKIIFSRKLFFFNNLAKVQLILLAVVLLSSYFLEKYIVLVLESEKKMNLYFVAILIYLCFLISTILAIRLTGNLLVW
jgi:hypothetical protein